MPTVAPQVRPTAENNAQTNIAQQSLGTTNSLRSMAGAAAIGLMALTNSEPANAQSPATQNAPLGQQRYIQVQGPDGKMILAPVVSAIPQGWTQVPGAPVYTVQVAPTAGAQSNLPVYGVPQNSAAPIANASVATAPAQAPMTQGFQGVAPQGGLQLVSPGGAPQVAQQMGQPMVGNINTQPIPGAQAAVPTLGASHELPTVAQAQLNMTAAQMQMRPSANPAIDQARLDLQAARLAEQRDVQYQRELMRYNNDAIRYHNRRAEYLGWFGDVVLPSKVPGPWVAPVPPRVPR